VSQILLCNCVWLTICSISAYPHLQFIVIINPSNGPGSAPWWPNADYVREIPRLNAFPNVQTVGYVHSTYCKRSSHDLIKDVETYAARSNDDSFQGLEVQGIFIDETVNLYSPKVKQYLDGIDEKIKANDGIGGDRLVRA
jgi:hypothetical protein